MKSPSQKRAEKAMVLAERAFDLATTQGNLTAEEMAQRLGVSRATFFRLFGSKEEALISAIIGPAGQSAEALRAAMPQGAGQPLWPLLRQAFEPVLLRIERAPDRFLERITQLRALPEIRAGAGKARLPRVLALTEALEERGLDLRSARIFAAAAIAALETTLALWAEAGADEDLRENLDLAFKRLASGL